ncbi:MAG: twin-arginine translocation signal domain-containing protein [Haloarcula sp.]
MSQATRRNFIKETALGSAVGIVGCLRGPWVRRRRNSSLRIRGHPAPWLGSIHRHCSKYGRGDATDVGTKIIYSKDDFHSYADRTS